MMRFGRSGFRLRGSLKHGGCLLALSLLAGQGYAEPVLLSTDIHRCAMVEDLQNRLECFAALEGSVSVDQPRVSLAPTGGDVAELGSAPGAGAQQRPALIRSSITRLQQRPRGEYVFSLANGEVWTQVQAESLPFAEGATVEIRRTTFGSHLLSQDSGRSTRVRRIDN